MTLEDYHRIAWIAATAGVVVAVTSALLAFRHLWHRPLAPDEEAVSRWVLRPAQAFVACLLGFLAGGAAGAIVAGIILQFVPQ